MDNGWVKHFIDGTIEHGSDLLVEQRLASWSRGRLDGIDHVEVWYGGRFVSLQGQGEFWQSDTFEARVLANSSTLIKRTISKKLNDKDHWVVLFFNGPENIVGAKIVSEVNLPMAHVFTQIQIKREWVGEWFSMDLESGKVNWRIGL